VQTAGARTGTNPVCAHDPYPAMYLPWWRFDAPRCTTCRQRLAQSGWMGVSGDGWPNMTRLCMPCYVRYARRPGDTWLIDHS
jgi:hypothetical protein